MTEKKSLIQKILDAVKHVQSLDVTKDGTNDYSHYDYVSEVQVSQLGHSLASNGVLFIPHCENVDHWTEQNKNGKIKNYVMVKESFELTDGHESKTGSMLGVGADATDKAVYKAETGAKKNFLMQFFLLASKDDPDNQKKNNHSNNGSIHNKKSLDKAMKKKHASNKQINWIHGLTNDIDMGQINDKRTLKAYEWAYNNDINNISMYSASRLINLLKNAPKKNASRK